MIFTVELLRYEKILASPAVSKLKPGLATYFMGPSENDNVKLFFFSLKKQEKSFFLSFVTFLFHPHMGVFLCCFNVTHPQAWGTGWVGE